MPINLLESRSRFKTQSLADQKIQQRQVLADLTVKESIQIAGVGTSINRNSLESNRPHFQTPPKEKNKIIDANNIQNYDIFKACFETSERDESVKD